MHLGLHAFRPTFNFEFEDKEHINGIKLQFT